MTNKLVNVVIVRTSSNDEGIIIFHATNLPPRFDEDERFRKLPHGWYWQPVIENADYNLYAPTGFEQPTGPFQYRGDAMEHAIKMNLDS